MRSPGIPRNLKKSHSAGKYTVRTRFPGFFQKTAVFPSRGTQTDVPGNRGNAIWATNSLGFVRSPGAPVGQGIAFYTLYWMGMFVKMRFPGFLRNPR